MKCDVKGKSVNPEREIGALKTHQHRREGGWKRGFELGDEMRRNTSRCNKSERRPSANFLIVMQLRREYISSLSKQYNAQKGRRKTDQIRPINLGCTDGFLLKTNF